MRRSDLPAVPEGAAVRITRLRYTGTVEDRNWELLLTKGLGIRDILGNVTPGWTMP